MTRFKSNYPSLVTQLPHKPSRGFWRKWAFLLCVSSVFVCVDQAVKWWVRQHIALGEWRTVTSFLDWTHVWNRGISFGFFECHSLIQRSILCLFVLIFIGFLLLLWSQAVTARQRWGSILMISGALSNGIDRVIHQGVFDFIRIHYASWDFPVFNVADMLITMGFLALLSEHFQWNALGFRKKRR